MKYFFWFIISCLLVSCKKESVNRAMVVSKIRDVSKLASVEFIVSKMIIAKKEKKVLHFFKLKDADFFAQTEATIKVGIDLSKITEEDIQLTEGKIKLSLPPVEVLNFSYPADKFKIDDNYSSLKSFGNRLSIEDVDKIYQEAQLQVMKDANYLGLRSTAEQKTIMLLNNLLENIGFEEVYVSFKPTNQPLLPTVTKENV